LAILAVGPHGPSRVNVSAASVVAGFQVIIDGRFLVITEDLETSETSSVSGENPFDSLRRCDDACYDDSTTF
jgi:hypothetical protein